MAQIGEVVASYRLTAVIGVGGMGAVFRAHDERLARDVALKLLAPELSGDPDFVDRFQREARTAASLHHPNVVPVFDAGVFNGQLYLAMMLVDGPNLATAIAQQSPFTVERVVDIVSQVASGLDAAHARGLVHRDVKPANILLTAGGRGDGKQHVYLADFGLARPADAQTYMTHHGSFMGTLQYISPEQLRGEQVDGRADQYALACTAYEMLTGRPPFERDSDAALMSAHLYSAPPPVGSRRPDLPAAVDGALQRALSKDPANRFATAGAFAQALAAAATATAEMAGPATVFLATPPAVPGQGLARGVAYEHERPGGRGSNQIAIALGLVLLAVVVGAGSVLAFNWANAPSTRPTAGPTVPGVAAQPSASASTPPGSAPATLAPTTLPTDVPLPSIVVPTIVPVSFPPITAPPLSFPPVTAPPITPEPVDWDLTLTPSATVISIDDSLTLYADANYYLDGTGVRLEIWRQSGASPDLLTTCFVGYECTAGGSPDEPRDTTYLARLLGSDNSVLDQETVVVHWVAPPPTPTPTPPPAQSWQVSLVVDPTSLPANEFAEITAYANANVDDYGYYIKLVNPDTGFQYKQCSTGSSCETPAHREAGTYSYQALITDLYGNVYAYSDVETITWY